MRVGFDATNILGHGGIKTYARELVMSLAREFSEDSFHLLTTFSSSKRESLLSVFRGFTNVTVSPAMPHPRMMGEGLRSLTGLLGSIMWLRASRHLDIVHLTDPFGAAALPRNCVSTVHDLFPLTRDEYAGTGLERRYIKTAPLTLRRSRAVITPSDYIRGQLMELYPDTRCPVVTVPEAASGMYRPCPPDPDLLGRHGLSAGGFFLYVGRADARKNVQGIISAHCGLSEELRKLHRLVLVLPRGEPFSDPASCRREDGAPVVLEDLAPEQLRTLYSSATAFVFPSLDEGFGLPVLEAMACGCPVITSSLSCLPETAGRAAVLVDPMDSAGMSGAMEAMARLPALRDECSAMGLLRAAEFSWERTARATMDVYRAALS